MFARVYDLLMEDVDYEALFRWLEPYLGKTDRIADIGCGSGYLLKELLMAGYQAIGIDLDPSMLSIARERLREADQPARLYQHDIRNPLGHRFDRLIAMFDVMNYFKGLKGVFHRMYQALNEGGMLIFDVYKEHVLQEFDGYVERESDPIPYIWTIDVKNNRLIHTVSASNDSDVIVQYVHRQSEIGQALQEAGFTFDMTEGIDPRKHYVIARK